MKVKDLVDEYGDYELDEITLKLTPPQPLNIWDLRGGNIYWTIDLVTRDINEGYRPTVCSKLWNNTRDNEVDRESGNCFISPSEAMQEVKKRECEALLKKYGGRRRNSFYLGKMMYYYEVAYAANDRVRLLLKTENTNHGHIYFEDREQIIRAMQDLGEERIINHLFGII